MSLRQMHWQCRLRRESFRDGTQTSPFVLIVCESERGVNWQAILVLLKSLIQNQLSAIQSAIVAMAAGADRSALASKRHSFSKWH